VANKVHHGEQEVVFEQRLLPLQTMPVPPAGQVDLWFLDMRELGSPLHAHEPGEPLPKLTPRQERTIRRFYLRLLLGAYLGIPGKEVRISRLVRGKPVLNHSHHKQGLGFSSAGSAGCCLIGISSEPSIGVDLEVTDRRTFKPLALARRYFSKIEFQSLQKLDKSQIDRSFLHTWACKEAVVKAAGLGIANQLCRFTVDTRPDRQPAVLAMEGDSASNWRLAMVRPAAGFIGSVALKSRKLKIKAYSLGLDYSRHG